MDKWSQYNTNSSFTRKSRLVVIGGLKYKQIIILLVARQWHASDYQHKFSVKNESQMHLRYTVVVDSNAQ